MITTTDTVKYYIQILHGEGKNIFISGLTKDQLKIAQQIEEDSYNHSIIQEDWCPTYSIISTSFDSYEEACKYVHEHPYEL